MHIVRHTSRGRQLRERVRHLITTVRRWEARANVFLGAALKNPCCRKQQATPQKYNSRPSTTHTG